MILMEGVIIFNILRKYIIYININNNKIINNNINIINNILQHKYY